ncbi:MAG: pyridoxal phosphate-dependent aminotransferase [Endomicrobium sp.]|jgi:aspartate aminotransferase|uniref:pyridoxal phosphate-dependent aminotransferase n=1 Tax=Candidatus Endomicrobiellum cubanum TaxID=3242325 RepID=UPI0028199493|nr:pyridoxal phosphate-dependent aminotransferase [Endomicrobium sp.]
MISKRAQSIKPSPTLAIDTKAKTLKQKGVDIINFGIGEPDFDTPKNIKDAAISAINNGFTKYCPVPGTLEIKNAIINKLQRDNNTTYLPEEIIVSSGAKHSLYNIFQAIIDPKDEVIIPAPYWVSYIDMVILAEGKPIVINTTDKNNFKITSELIKRAITSKTKAIIINSPSNPTGVTYCQNELKEIAQICLENKILIISDEIYEKLVYDNFKFTSIVQACPQAKDTTILINGVSKAYAMTGWRIGYAAGNKEIISSMTKLQSQSTSNASSISIKAAVEALNGTQEYVETMRKEFEKRRNYIVERLNSIEGINCIKPEGAFYVFPNISSILGKSFNGKVINSDIEFADYLLDQVKIAVVPGAAFGAKGYIRISYATSIENVQKGIDRLENALESKI